ncbi:MAG: response regulator [Candidatus Gygaella obscura]|nr:response regulator [Candidatus Gygaella obscura]
MSIKILIADDEPDIRDIIKIVLTKEGYQVIETCDGEEALREIQKQNPDMVILDYSMPKMNGKDLCQVIKKDLLMQHMPVVLLTGKSDIDDKVRGLEAGADDYITKPFVPKELIARIKMIISRMQRDLDANPLSKLPGNISIMSELQNRINSDKPFGVCYIDLDKFKSYNDKYGFEHGDDVIKETAQVIIASVAKCGANDDFIGHIGGDDFVVTTIPERIEALCSEIIKEFDSAILGFYNEEDRSKGFITAKDRQGNPQQTPLMSISIGVVTNESRKITHVAQVGEIGAELKSAAKKVGKSNYVLDKRAQ